SLAAPHGVATAASGKALLADRCRTLGRSFKLEGRPDEADAAWRQALDLLAAQIEAHPGDDGPRRRWCDCANDLAWLRANHPDPSPPHPAPPPRPAATRPPPSPSPGRRRPSTPTPRRTGTPWAPRPTAPATIARPSTPSSTPGPSPAARPSTRCSSPWPAPGWVTRREPGRR